MSGAQCLSDVFTLKSGRCVSTRFSSGEDRLKLCKRLDPVICAHLCLENCVYELRGL